MLGAIIGDIAGSRFEFNPTNDYNFEMFSEECDFTDDTICTIAIADALLKKRDFGESLHDWCNRYPHPMGGYGCSFANWVHSKNPKPYNSFGNGAAMRVSPIAWFNLNSFQGEVQEATACTHNHPEGIRGALAVASAVHNCLNMHVLYDHIGKEEILGFGLKRAIHDLGYSIDFSLDSVRNKFDETCQGTVPVAFKIISESHSFEDAIRKAVSLGADADTLGAIVGSIAEAIWGIPEWMKKKAFGYLPEEMKKVLREFREKCPWKLTKNLQKQQKKEEKEQLDQLKAIMRWKLGLGDFNKLLEGKSPLPPKNKVAGPNDWNTKPMPTEGISNIELSIPIKEREMDILRKGHIPEVQEDHWFMYCSGDLLQGYTIRYYRSWTGMCAFEAHFRYLQTGFLIDRLIINQELASFGVNGDEPAIFLFRYLITAEIGGDAEGAWDDYENAWMHQHIKDQKK